MDLFFFQMEANGLQILNDVNIIFIGNLPYLKNLPPVLQIKCFKIEINIYNV